MKPMAKLHLSRQRLYEKACEDSPTIPVNSGGEIDDNNTNIKTTKRQKNSKYFLFFIFFFIVNFNYFITNTHFFSYKFC